MPDKSKHIYVCIICTDMGKKCFELVDHIYNEPVAGSSNMCKAHKIALACPSCGLLYKKGGGLKLKKER